MSREFAKFRYPITAETTTTLDLMEYANDGTAQAAYVTSNAGLIQSFSEAVIIDQGTYSLKVVSQDASSGEQVLRTIGAPIDISGKNSVKFSAYATAYRDNFNIRIADNVGGDIIDQVISVKKINQWVDYIINISGVLDANKSAIDEIEFESNSAIGSTIYIDNLIASTDQDVVVITSSSFALPDNISKVSNVVKTESISGAQQRAKLGESRKTFKIDFKTLDRTDFDNLNAFFDTYTDYDLNPFEFTNLIESEITNVYLESWSMQRIKSKLGIINMTMIERIAP